MVKSSQSLKRLTQLTKNFLNKSMLKYLIVGATAFTSEYIAFLILYSTFSFKIYTANSVSFCIGLLVSFTLNRIWTFKTDSYKHQSSHQFILYVALALVNLTLTNLIVGGLKHVGVDPFLCKVVAMASIVVWNFAIFKTIIFKEAAVKT